jgi:hypothetical protein
MRTDFFQGPSLERANSIEDRIMARIGEEIPLENVPADAGFSFRGWIITGCIILVSLSTAFLGNGFSEMIAFAGSRFILPLGILTGCIITAYGALFIGSHLEELSERFGLR